MSFSETQILAMHAEHMAGASMNALAKRYQCSRETIRQQFLKRGLERRTNQYWSRKPSEAEVEHVIALYKRFGTVSDVARRSPLPRRVVSEIVAAIPNRESYRRRTPALSSYDVSELIRALERAAQYSGEPLSIPGYRDAARKLGLPAFDTVVRAFAEEEDPWQAALAAAGVEGNPPRGRRAGAISAEQCIESVAECFREFGQRVSFSTYCYWAADRGVPSGATVRNLVGWNAAAEEALAYA